MYLWITELLGAAYLDRNVLTYFDFSSVAQNNGKLTVPEA
jgi:hypothetical protein